MSWNAWCGNTRSRASSSCPHLDDVEEAVEHVLDGVDVLDARERDVTLVAEHEAGSDHQLVLVVLQAERQVTDDGRERGGNDEHQQPCFPTGPKEVAGLAGRA
jgi:hypothetical protein